MKPLTKNFLKGLLFIAPISLTLYIVHAIFRWVDGLGNRLLGPWLGAGNLTTGIGFLVTIALITAIGYLSSLWLSAALFNWIGGLFEKSPLLKGIYGTIRDTLQSFLGEKKALSKVVLVSFPGLGAKRLGFLTREVSPFPSGGEEQVVVYLPHSFQISGEMVIVPKKNVKILDLPAEAALKMIVSAGLVKEK